MDQRRAREDFHRTMVDVAVVTLAIGLMGALLFAMVSELLMQMVLHPRVDLSMLQAPASHLVIDAQAGVSRQV